VPKSHFLLKLFSGLSTLFNNGALITAWALCYTSHFREDKTCKKVPKRPVRHFIRPTGTDVPVGYENKKAYSDLGKKIMSLLLGDMTLDAPLVVH